MKYEDIATIPSKISGIYKITNLINNKNYIGQSVNVKTRWRNHIRISKDKDNRGYNYPLYCAFRKYGIENFDFEILEEVIPDNLDEKEIYYIKKYDSFNNGYNQTSGGSSPHGEEIGTSIYKEKDIIKIREMYRDGKSFKEVLEAFPYINKHSIKAIWSGAEWSHIMPEVFTDKEVMKRRERARHIQSQGENNVTSTLTNNQVKEIIKLLEKGELTNIEIAKKFNVKETVINAINTCQNWRWIHNYKNNIRRESNIDDFNSEEDIKKAIHALETESIAITLRDLSKKLKVSESTLYNLNSCINWTHLHNYKHNIRKESHNIYHDIRCGEGNKSSLYKEKQILKVIDLLKNTDLTYKEIEEKTGVKTSSIGSINRCRNWRHLHNFKKNIREESKFTSSK